MILIDTHCHLDADPFIGDEVGSLALAEEANISQLIVPAVAVDRFSHLCSLAQHYPQIFIALGLHPHFLNSHNDDQDLALLDMALTARSSSLVAVGECGLDYRLDPLSFDRQHRLLQQQILLAKKHDLPLILHSVKSHDKLAAMLRQAKVPRRGVVHAFSGSLQQSEVFIGLGYALGVGGVITYPRAQKTRAAIASAPLNALVLETDAPDMPLFGFQGEPNRPERLQLIFSALCEIRDESPHEIAQQLYLTSQDLFALSV